MASCGLSKTPKKLYLKDNLCVLCGEAFTQRHVTALGEVIESKQRKDKLRLTNEREENIFRAINIHVKSSDEILNKNGVCAKCYRKVENIVKHEFEMKRLREEIQQSMKNVPHTHRTTNTMSINKEIVREKRLLKSPLVYAPYKLQKTTEMSTIQYQTTSLTVPVSPNIRSPLSESFRNFSASPIHINGPSPKRSMLLLSRFTQGTHQNPVPIRPKPPSFSEDKSAEIQKSSKRSIKFSETTEKDLIGKVEVIVHYPSGQKVKTVTSEAHKTICKCIVRGGNVDRIIVDSIMNSNPEAVADGCAKIIQKETQMITQKSVGSILRKKDFEDIFNFNWIKLHEELERLCPSFLTIMKSVVSDKPAEMSGKDLRHALTACAIAVHGRNQAMSTIQYMVGLILTHGGCTLRTVERLCSLGLSVHPSSISSKLAHWQGNLDEEIMKLKESWPDSSQRYQLVGDNWDKNILPSYRTSDRKTTTLHLFNVIAVVDRFVPPVNLPNLQPLETTKNRDLLIFIPSVDEQKQLLKELTFLFATSLISNHPQLNKVIKNYPTHLEHPTSSQAGIKTSQYPLGLYDYNENKSQEMIRLLKELSEKYVPKGDKEIIESVFFGGDKLTDERIHGAQLAMRNAKSPEERLEGFISKMEDFHRLMNFMEAIVKLTYDTSSGQESGTMYYFRNFLNQRNVKADVKTSYRAYKMMYYTVLDALFMIFFLRKFNLENTECEIPLPEGFCDMNEAEKSIWLNDVCESILKNVFFETKDDIFENLRNIFQNPDHPENYWFSNFADGRLHCHFCSKSYVQLGSLQAHEKKAHDKDVSKTKDTSSKTSRTIEDYLLMLFKLTILHKNLDSAVDMADGARCIRSAKYELPLYNKTNKIKYVIGTVHLSALTSGMLSHDQTERLIHNRCINLQGGKNNNIALDEYVEMVNRDSKVACSGHQTKESILLHSKEYPHLVNYCKHFDQISQVHVRKGFHHLPSYMDDVKKVVLDLLKLNVFSGQESNSLKSKLIAQRFIFDHCGSGLPAMIYRHNPSEAFRRK